MVLARDAPVLHVRGSGIHADGALKDRQNYDLYDDETLWPFPHDWFTRAGRVVLTG